MEYYNNILCIEGGWLYREGDIMSKANYKLLCYRNHLNILRRACRNTPALVAYDSIPERFKKQIIEKVGDPYKMTKHRQFRNNIQPDTQAHEYFSNYLLEDGRNLPNENIIEYTTNAQLLNAINITIANRTATRRALGGRLTKIWEQMADVLDDLKNEYDHSLPVNHRRLKDRFKTYMDEGYPVLIHRGFCNANSRKVNDDIESLVLSLSAMEYRFFDKTVHDLYLKFLAGDMEVVDINTGEIFDRASFTDKDGLYIQISDSTVWNILHNPKNRLTLKKHRDSAINFKTQQMPYNHRHRPQYSLSKISMDDRALPRKAADGTWVNAYYAYDVQSECFIGWSHGKDKTIEIVYKCFRHMYELLNEHDLPWPAECEVENHLMKGISDKLYAMFPYVRFCNPQNSREKRAEHAIKMKKYGDEKTHQKGVGRWHSKHDAYTTNQDFSENLSPDELIADDIESLLRSNSAPHSIYKNKSRWQVLLENLNPDLVKPQKRIIFKEIGHKTSTSIRNNDFVQVQYEHYAIDSMDILARLKPNNYKVEAYYLPEEDGNIGEVYLYQDDTFLCRATKYERYNEAQAERTERDEEIRVEQAKRQAKTRKQVKDDTRIRKVEVVYNTNIDDVPYVSVVDETIPETEMDEYERLISEANGEEYDKLRAYDSL